MTATNLIYSVTITLKKILNDYFLIKLSLILPEKNCFSESKQHLSQFSSEN